MSAAMSPGEESTKWPHPAQVARLEVPESSAPEEWHAGREDDRRTVALVATLISAALALVLALARYGLPGTMLHEALVTTGLLAFVVHAPELNARSSTRWFTSGPLLSLGALAILGPLGLLPEAVAREVGTGVATVGALCALLATLRWARRPSSFGRRAVVVVLALVGGIVMSAMIWSTEVQRAEYDAALYVDRVHLDTLFHGALANILGTYGVPSTGIDGLVRVAYHFGSHWYFAQLARLIGTRVMPFYGAYFGMLFLPMVTFAVLSIGVSARTAFGATHVRLRSSARFWLVAWLGTAGVLPAKIATTYGVAPNRLVSSESNTLGYVIFFLLVALFINAYHELRVVGRAPTRASKVASALILLTAAPVLLVTKVSIAYLFLVGATYFAWRLRECRRAIIWIPLAVGWLMFPVLRSSVLTRGQGGHLSPFFPLRSVEFDWTGLYFIVVFLFRWIFIGVRMLAIRARCLGDALAAASEERILDVEAVLVLTVAGAVPSFCLALPSGNWTYFLDPPHWIALGLLLAYVDGPVGLHIAPPAETWRARLRALRLAPLAIALGLVIAIGTSMLSMAKRVATMAYDNFVTRLQLVSDAPVPMRDVALALLGRTVKTVLHDARGDTVSLRDAVLHPERSMAKHPRAAMLRLLDELASRSESERRRTVLYVPHSTSAYWFMPRDGRTDKLAFLAPAVTGIATIDGLPPQGPVCPADGFPHYVIREPGRQELPGYGRSIVQRAGQLGFEQVLVVVPTEDGTNGVRAVRIPTAHPDQIDGLVP